MSTTPERTGPTCSSRRPIRALRRGRAKAQRAAARAPRRWRSRRWGARVRRRSALRPCAGGTERRARRAARASPPGPRAVQAHGHVVACEKARRLLEPLLERELDLVDRSPGGDERFEPAARAAQHRRHVRRRREEAEVALDGIPTDAAAFDEVGGGCRLAVAFMRGLPFATGRRTEDRARSRCLCARSAARFVDEAGHSLPRSRAAIFPTRIACVVSKFPG